MHRQTNNNKGSSMYPELHNEVLPRLLNDFAFKEGSSEFLQQGLCPACGKKELYTNASSPWLLRCGRLNKCGESYHIKEIYPELFNSWSDRFPVSQTTSAGTIANPNATADAYLQHGRGFDISQLKGWYSQGSFYCGKRDIGTATVRFEIAPGVYWERFIDRPERFGKQKANFVGKYQGLCWLPPSWDPLSIVGKDELWLTEGVFDAIALLQNGVAAVSLMSCNNFPEKFLDWLHLKLPASSRPTLVFALDDGKAGEEYTIKWVKKARALGWKASAAQPEKGKRVKLDWNELHQRNQLTKQNLEKYRYYGKLLVAEKPTEKALLMFNRSGLREFSFSHNNRWLLFKLDLDRFDKAKRNILDNSDGCMKEEDVIEEALKESGTIKELAACFPTALYCQKNEITDESWHYFRIDWPTDQPSVKAAFTNGQLAAASEFKKRLLGIGTGGVYTGTTTNLDMLLKEQLANIKEVKAIDYIGYTPDYRCYVFNDVAVKDGNIYELNDEDFFEINRLSIKSLSRSVSFHINKDMKSLNNTWFQQLYQAFGIKGVVTLAFWVGSYFAEQIRETQESYPYLEISGKPGTGKTTLIEFLWKLSGCKNTEGFNPVKSSAVGRARKLAQVSNLPVVMIEGDVSDEKDTSKQKGFDWDEYKDLYNGRSVRTTGIKNNSNDTREPLFRGALIIAQNAEVKASDAFMERIIQISTDKSGQTLQSKAAADWMARVDIAEVSGFILKAIQQESAIMEIVNKKLEHHESLLDEKHNIKHNRITKNHAQLCALVDSLALITDISTEQVAQTQDFIGQLAVKRKQTINADPQVIQEFWDIFEFINGDGHPVLDHSQDEKLIAINLNHFAEVAFERRQSIPPLTELKRLLKNCRAHKFLGINTVNSVIYRRWNEEHKYSRDKKPTSVKCWVFKRGDL